MTSPKVPRTCKRTRTIYRGKESKQISTRASIPSGWSIFKTHIKNVCPLTDVACEALVKQIAAKSTEDHLDIIKRIVALHNIGYLDKLERQLLSNLTALAIEKSERTDLIGFQDARQSHPRKSQEPRLRKFKGPSHE